MHPLISTDELAGRLGEVVLCDIRWSLTNPQHGRAAYEDGHIPGAVFVDLDEDLSAPPGTTGRHPLPPVDVFARTLGRLGITPSDEVIVYDDVRGAVASRMWWMLRSIGHERSRLLDGGYETWVDDGHPVQTGSSVPEPAAYPAPKSFHGVVPLEKLSGKTLIDARAPDRYTGEREPVDPKAGHIPGALNLPHSESLSAKGTFRPPEELAQHFSGIEGRAVVSCGSGVTACHAALAMVLAGREMPAVYIGSFSEWSRRDMPVRTGTTP